LLCFRLTHLCILYMSKHFGIANTKKKKLDTFVNSAFFSFTKGLVLRSTIQWQTTRLSTAQIIHMVQFEIAVLWLVRAAAKVIMWLATVVTPVVSGRKYLPLHQSLVHVITLRCHFFVAHSAYPSFTGVIYRQFLQSQAQEHNLQCQTISKNMSWGWTFKAFKMSVNWGYLVKRPSGQQGVKYSLAFLSQGRNVKGEGKCLRRGKVCQ
jgi:hypothetical protein